MIDGFVLTALAVIALAAVAMFQKQIGHALGQAFWSFVFYADMFAHDDEDEACPDWVDPDKWEASKI